MVNEHRFKVKLYGEDITSKVRSWAQQPALGSYIKELIESGNERLLTDEIQINYYDGRKCFYPLYVCEVTIFAEK